MIGQVLGERYELLERIGGGGMALVYRGQDRLLNRKVAVKVLRQQYVNDEEFIRRFRREAQAAASLSHPNVVSIYDVGQEDETHYIVMEFIDGKTLNDLIKERAPIPVEEAIRISAQICDALDHAHINQIIHRDIKPHNILIGKNGRVKVTDFGIARAADASQITQTGSVVGSVHYFSPEHAKGTLTGAQSDLYSLGIVLYQMLTGRLPFLGESPISVALKHLQEDVEEPRKVNPLIPQSVENIILKSMRKKPEERYRSAKEMLEDIETCLQPERRNEPKITFVAEDADYDDDVKTRVLPAIRADHYVPDDDPDEEPAYPARKKRRWLPPLIWTVVLAGLLVALYLGVQYLKERLEVPEHDIPNFVGVSADAAMAQLGSLQLQGRVIVQHNKDYEKGLVFRQDPALVKVKVNTLVTLYVSDGPEPLNMPNWIGKQADDVMKNELPRFGIAAEQVERTDQFSEQRVGAILSQTPESGAPYDPKTVAIQLVVSNGREKVEMPDLIGKTVDEAKAIAMRNDFEVKVIERPTYKKPEGRIFDQFPYKVNQLVDPGAEVDIYVSTGFPPEAKRVTYSIDIPPVEKGKDSKIDITFSDATGDGQNWGSRTIFESQKFDIVLVLSEEKDGTVDVRRNGERLDLYTISYKSVENGATIRRGAGTGGGSNPAGSQTQTGTPTNGGTPTGTGEAGGSGTTTPGSTTSTVNQQQTGTGAQTPPASPPGSANSSTGGQN